MIKSRLASALCAAVIFAGCATSQNAASKEQTDTENNSTEDYQELIKDAESYEGYFDLYQKDSDLYISIPVEKLNEQFLMNFELARGIGSSGLFGGTMLNIFEGLLVSFEKHDGKIFLVEHPHRYRAREGTPEARSVDLTFGDSVIESAKVEAFNTDSSRMLSGAYDWSVCDLSGIATRVDHAVGEGGEPGQASFDKERSHLEKIQSFPENVNIQAR